MRNSRVGLLLAFAAGLTASCTAPAEPAPADTAFSVTASIQDVMLSIVDPSADGVWESVATIITADGIEERRPRTDEDWDALYHHAIRLAEAPNLLVMEGRRVAREGFTSEFPGIELEPEEIQALLDEDPAAWREYATALHDEGVGILEAVESRNVEALFEAGEKLDVACENCHRQYWYPNDPTYQNIDPPSVRD